MIQQHQINSFFQLNHEFKFIFHPRYVGVAMAWEGGRIEIEMRIQTRRGANEKWSRFRFVYGERFSFLLLGVTPC